MGRVQQLLGLGILLAIAVGLGYAGYRLKTNAKVEYCQACGRMIHEDMRTVAMVGDKREIFCCPTCALSQSAQTHKPIRFVELSDYTTGHPLRPADAYAVEGSDVIPCERTRQMLNSDGQPIPKSFDRCSPSIIAFANLADANQFAEQHGGSVSSFADVLTEHNQVGVPAQ